MKKYYLFLILAAIAAFIAATYYRISPPVYLLKQYDLKIEQESLTELNDYEVDIYDSILTINKIPYNSPQADQIYDSLIKAKLTPDKKQLFEKPLSEYLLSTKKDSLIIIKDKAAIELLKQVAGCKSSEDLPKQYKKYTSDYSFDVALYIQQKDLPLSLTLDIPPFKRYFISTEDLKHYLTITKIDPLYSADELIDKGLLNDKSIVSVPENILYPFRSYRIWLLPLLVILFLLPLYSTLKLPENFTLQIQLENKELKKAKVFWIISIVLTIILTSLPILKVPIEYSIPIISLGSGILFFIVILFFLYRARARAFNKIMCGENILALWQYDPIFWQKFTEKYLQNQRTASKSTLIYVSIIIAVIFGFFAIIDSDVTFIMIGIGLLMILLLSFFAFVAPKISARNLQKSQPICIIGHHNVILGSQFHYWKTYGFRYNYANVRYDEDNYYLDIGISVKSRYGWSEQTLSIPVPPGKFDEARLIAQKLNDLNKKEETFDEKIEDEDTK